MIKNFQPRLYQETILATAIQKNTLVVLPTGLGKTNIFLMLASQRLKQYPQSKILFLAPTKPLVEQHLQTFQKYFSFEKEKLAVFTGQTAPEKRTELYQNKQIIFSTPQVIENDIISSRLNLKDVSLLGVDEAHRAVGDYAYVFVTKQYHKKSEFPRVLALTASPGSDLEKIREVCQNLHIEAVEARTPEDPDVKPYIKPIKTEWLKVELPPQFKAVQKYLKDCYQSKLWEVKNYGYLSSLLINKLDLLKLQSQLHGQLARGQKDFQLLKSVSLLAEAMKIQHALELLETQSLSALKNYLTKIQEQARTTKTKAVKNLVQDLNFKSALAKTKQLAELNLHHPKLTKLKELVKDETEKNPRTKIIIFTQYRDSGSEIAEQLQQLRQKVRLFVGQAKKGETGLSQKKQKEMLDQFRNEEFNTLVATSVHPDEFIVVKNPKNQIEIVKIGEFVNKFEKNKSKLKQWKALSGNKTVGFYPITDIFKHKRKSNVVKVKLDSGFECLVTEDHSLFTFNKERKLIPSKPKENLFINLLFSGPRTKKLKEIDIVKELNKNLPIKEKKKIFCLIKGLNQPKIRELASNLKVLKVLRGKEKNMKNISRITKLDSSTVTNVAKRLQKNNYIYVLSDGRNKKCSLSLLGKKYFTSLTWLFKNMYYHKRKYRVSLEDAAKSPSFIQDFFETEVGVWYGKKTVKRFISLNEDLARFLGLYVAEGHARLTKTTSEVYLAARKKKMQKLMVCSIKKGLNFKPSVIWRGVSIDAQISYHLVKNVFRCGIGAHYKEVPNIIFSAEDKIKWAFLEGYFLGDGYHDTKMGRIVLTTASRKLIVGLLLLLRQLGIKKITLQKQNNIYRFCIHESLPFAKIKQKKSNKKYYSLIPGALKSEYHFEVYGNSYSKKKLAGQSCRTIQNINDFTCFDYIKEISVLEKQPEFVYDIAIKKTERFVGGTGLISLHNSVGEEGLDIPAVDLVVFYEPIPSAIRHIQRRGRTGRQEQGRVVILQTDQTRDSGYRWSAYHKEKRMFRTLNQIKKEFSLKSSPTLTQFMPEKQKVQIIADHREKGSGTIKELVNLGLDLKLEQLDSADYLCSPQCAVEFKTVPDFVSSIIDGRLLDQLKYLKKNYARPLVIIEGEEDLYSVRKIHPNAIRGMLAAITVSYGIPLIQTKNFRETAALLSVIAKREQDKDRDFSSHSRKPLTLKDQQEYFVSSLPSVGPQLAQDLLKHFKTIKKITNAEEQELQKVPKVGPTIAKKIRELFETEYRP